MKILLLLLGFGVHSFCADGAAAADKEEAGCKRYRQIHLLDIPTCSRQRISLLKETGGATLGQLQPLGEGRPTLRMVCHKGEATSLAFIDNTNMLVGTSTGAIEAWDYSSLRVAGLYKKHNGRVSALNVPHPDAFISGGTDGKVRIWDMRASSFQQKLSCKGAVTALAYNGKDMQLAMGSNIEDPVTHRFGQGYLKIANLIGTYQIKQRLAEHSSFTAAYSQDGKYLFSDDDFWNSGLDVYSASADDYKTIASISFGNNVTPSALAVCNTTLVAGLANLGEDNTTLMAWDIQDNAVPIKGKEFPVCDDIVLNVVACPAKNELCTLHANRTNTRQRTIRVWRNGDVIQLIKEFPVSEYARHLAVTPDGSCVAYNNSNGFSIAQLEHDEL